VAAGQYGFLVKKQGDSAWVASQIARFLNGGFGGARPSRFPDPLQGDQKQEARKASFPRKLRKKLLELLSNLSTTSHSFHMKLPSKTARWALMLALTVSLAVQLHLVISVVITINEAAAAVLQLAAAAK
jgi:hypothetical protein